MTVAWMHRDKPFDILSGLVSMVLLEFKRHSFFEQRDCDILTWKDLVHSGWNIQNDYLFVVQGCRTEHLFPPSGYLPQLDLGIDHPRDSGFFGSAYRRRGNFWCGQAPMSLSVPADN
jgi:hypothetical protein